MTNNLLVNKSYYVDDFKGKNLKQFDRLNIASQSIIEFITMKTADTLSISPFLVNIKNAICYQIEFMADNGGIDAIQGNDGKFKSESVGDLSYTKFDKDNEMHFINGMAISPMVEISLANTGLWTSRVETRY